jgi:hypothetical protein
VPKSPLVALGAVVAVGRHDLRRPPSFLVSIIVQIPQVACRFASGRQSL